MNVEPLHFSLLKNLARSPAHLKAALEDPRATTRAMDLGAISHRMILGPRQEDGELVVWTGKVRRGKEWDAFQKEHESDVIVTAKDFYNAKRIAAAAQADPIAAELLEGARFEVPLAWEEAGFKFETSGIDILNGAVLAELKTTTNVEPEKLKRHALQMLYHCQLELYRGALESTGQRIERVSILAVETTPPHVVTVLDLTPGLLAFARKNIVQWTERLKVCLSDDHWPGYLQRAETFDVPLWYSPDGEEDEAAASEPEEEDAA